MLDWFWSSLASTSAFITFFTIFLMGLLFSVFSLIFGGHGDHDLGHDVGHDGHGDSHHDGDTGLTSFFAVGMLSVRGMALLATGFGGAGMIVQLYTGRTFFATVAGAIFGYAFAFLILLAVRALKSQQANSLIDTNSAVGISGTVVTSIPPNGLGEIRCVVGGAEVTRTAVSKNGELIRTGTRVRVEETSGATMVVVPQNAV